MQAITLGHLNKFLKLSVSRTKLKSRLKTKKTRSSVSLPSSFAKLCFYSNEYSISGKTEEGHNVEQN